MTLVPQILDMRGAPGRLREWVEAVRAAIPELSSDRPEAGLPGFADEPRQACGG